MAECVVCGIEIPTRKKYCTEHRPKSVFERAATGESPYGQYDGPAGSWESWRQAFGDKFTPDEIRGILGDQSPWDVLEISPNADDATVRRAFRRLSHRHHPDHGGDREMFQRIKAARDALLKD